MSSWWFPLVNGTEHLDRGLDQIELAIVDEVLGLAIVRPQVVVERVDLGGAVPAGVHPQGRVRVLVDRAVEHRPAALLGVGSDIRTAAGETDPKGRLAPNDLHPYRSEREVGTLIVAHPPRGRIGSVHDLFRDTCSSGRWPPAIGTRPFPSTRCGSGAAPCSWSGAVGPRSKGGGRSPGVSSGTMRRWRRRSSGRSARRPGWRIRPLGLVGVYSGPDSGPSTSHHERRVLRHRSSAPSEGRGRRRGSQMGPAQGSSRAGLRPRPDARRCAPSPEDEASPADAFVTRSQAGTARGNFGA